MISAGVIDADYRGEVGVIRFNHSGDDFRVKRGDCIAQLFFEKIQTPQIKEVTELLSTDRRSDEFPAAQEKITY